MAMYEEQLEWLFNRFPSYQKVGKNAYKPGTGTMTAFDDLQGNPHHSFKSIHIAGTNGKGSTSHMLAAALAANGLRVGLYTSPHLLDFRERIRIIEKRSFRYVEKEFVSDFIERNQPFFEQFSPSFFEITTAMAFEYFKKECVDIAVIETGLGGRLDSTNIITPVLSIITNIGLEHCEHLGNTLAEIAYEKAGIIKHNVPTIIGETTPETKPVFISKAASEQSEITFAEECSDDIGVSINELDLKGDYQRRNLRTLSAAINKLSSIGILEINDTLRHSVCNAASITGLRGRWETLQKGNGKPTVICDTGHNAHGFRWIREQIDKISCDYDQIFFILGVVSDKDVAAIAHLLPHDVSFIFTQANSPRAMKALDLAKFLDDYDIHGQITDSVKEALHSANSQASEEDLIFVCGSNFVIAELLQLFD